MDLSKSSTADADDSNGGAIAAAILGTLGLVALLLLLAAVIYVRQQRQTTKQLEDGDSQHNSVHLSNGGMNPTALSLTDEVFKVAPNGQGIRLESVVRGNPVYRSSVTASVVDAPVTAQGIDEASVVGTTLARSRKYRPQPIAFEADMVETPKPPAGGLQLPTTPAGGRDMEEPSMTPLRGSPRLYNSKLI